MTDDAFAFMDTLAQNPHGGPPERPRRICEVLQVDHERCVMMQSLLVALNDDPEVQTYTQMIARTYVHFRDALGEPLTSRKQPTCICWPES